MNERVRLQTILAPTDFSPGAEPALAWARTLAAQFDSEVIVLHALDLDVTAVPTPVAPPPVLPAAPVSIGVQQATRDEVQRQLDALLQRFPRGRSALVEGAAGPAIVEAAGTGVDLIVMGTHGRSGLARAVMGSVAEYVLRRSTVPVLAVRARGGREKD